MAKPTEYLNWDPTLSNVIDPPSGLKATGNLPSMTLAAQYYNWAINLCDQWIQYFDGQTGRTQISVSAVTLLTAIVRTCLADPGSSSFNVMLPTSIAGNKGLRYTIVNSNYSTANTVTVVPFTASGNTLAGQTSVVLGQGEYITFEDNGSGAYFQVG